MSYYRILGLEKEPFSTSPDPNFFYRSQEHKVALTKLLIEIRLRRGLSIILGDVGTGKTTLSRKLFQLLDSRESIEFHMILDPSYDNEFLFLSSLSKLFAIKMDMANPNIIDFKQAIKKFLFQKGVNENKIVVLLIDEIQKINPVSLEALRMLLNYETNEFKLLQLVLLGQIEFFPQLIKTKNFADRVNLKYTLGPFNEQETKEMIRFRIRQAGYRGGEELFREEAFKKIYDYTRGSPRRIAMLCHTALKNLVMKNRPAVDDEIIEEIIESELKLGWQSKDLILKNSY